MVRTQTHRLDESLTRIAEVSEFNEVDDGWRLQSFSHPQTAGTVGSAAFLFVVLERRDPAVELSPKKRLAVVQQQVCWLRLE